MWVVRNNIRYVSKQQRELSQDEGMCELWWTGTNKQTNRQTSAEAKSSLDKAKSENELNYLQDELNYLQDKTDNQWSRADGLYSQLSSVLFCNILLIPVGQTQHHKRGNLLKSNL